VKRPLSIGEVQLDSGEWVHGFVSSEYYCLGNVDQLGHWGIWTAPKEITHLGGWRKYIASLSTLRV